MTAERQARDEHLKERGFFVEMDHQEAGKLRYPSVPFRFSETESSTRVSAPLLGQHNNEVYGDGLGYSGEELARLRRKGLSKVWRRLAEGLRGSRGRWTGSGWLTLPRRGPGLIVCRCWHSWGQRSSR